MTFFDEYTRLIAGRECNNDYSDNYSEFIDYGMTDDGYIIPPPCIICGTPMCACIGDPYQAP